MVWPKKRENSDVYCFTPPFTVGIFYFWESSEDQHIDSISHLDPILRDAILWSQSHRRTKLTFIEYWLCAVCMCVLVAQMVWLFATPWIIAHQASLSMGFPRQESWSGLPFPSPGDLPDPGTENSCVLHWQVDSLPLSHQGSLLIKVKALKTVSST